MRCKINIHHAKHLALVTTELGTEQEDRQDGFHSAAVGVARPGERRLSGDGGRGHLLPVGDDHGERSRFH